MSPGPKRLSWLEWGLLAALLLAIAIASLLVWLLVIRPVNKANDAALAHYLQTVREAKAPPPPASGPDTQAALRAIAASKGHTIDRSTSSIHSDADSELCYEVALHGGPKVAVRLWGHASAPLVTNVGLVPPCSCKRGGAIAGCTP